jgi:hypothetical protein
VAGFFRLSIQRAFCASSISEAKSKISGIRVKVKLIIVAIFVAGIKGRGLRNHSITFFNDERVVVAVRIILIKTIIIIRQPNNNPEYKPSRVGPVNERFFNIGVPGILNEWTIITKATNKKKDLISLNSFLTGKAAPNNVIIKTKVRINRSSTLLAELAATLNIIMQSNLIRLSIRWIIDFPGRK